ncbi:hypothetical protein FJZ40_05060 [Candidatus Shapirobacteria bacterium]|nr:hypothetical protein [Candidatus Shapirobacteria bacterium]
MSPANPAIRGTTQDALPVEDIKDDLVILRDGSCCMVLTTTAINFSLLSSSEQDATIFAYASLLNSLAFTVQLLIRSQRKDVSGYLDLLAEAEDGQANPLLKEQIKRYRRYIEETVKKNNVLDKKFYLVIPFSILELGAKQALGSTLLPRKTRLPYSKDYILERAKIALYPKRDHLVRQFNRLGLAARQLTTQELISLFYEIYNPQLSQSQKIAVGAEYTSPMVLPTVKIG